MNSDTRDKLNEAKYLLERAKQMQSVQDVFRYGYYTSGFLAKLC